MEQFDLAWQELQSHGLYHGPKKSSMSYFCFDFFTVFVFFVIFWWFIVVLGNTLVVLGGILFYFVLFQDIVVY